MNVLGNSPSPLATFPRPSLSTVPMSESPFQAIFLTLEKISHGVQTLLSQFAGLSNHQSPTNGRRPLFSLASSINPNPLNASSNSSVLLPKELTNDVSSVLSSPSRYSNWVNLKISLFCVSGNWVYGVKVLVQSILLVHCRLQGKPVMPVTKEELGRATWIFLHTLAAQYPDKPTRQQRKDVKELMDILSRMYPCKECANHLKEILRPNPVQVGSQAEFSRWLCHAHNVVNRSLGTVVFSCERVDARRGKLDCEQRACDLQGNTKIFGDKTQ
ncbi:hypothetical protein RHMOL_Rhmol05G0110500 [Rhododendron molle]|uniref:Uncharacterized protein n=1 Tax=Rhododendron molle TaxID=49168 RepID=A0ACC0NP77_RHOML|nr:hypothetical protein RHMOL_Rhmol05G0110500 [Rhododendron molle]